MPNTLTEPTQELASPSEAKSQLSTFTNIVVTAMERISTIAEKGPVNLLLSLGTGLIIFALALKIKIGDSQIGTLTTPEFISLLLLAALLLVLGSLLRLYQFKSGLDTLRAQQKVGADMLTRTTEVAATLAKPVGPQSPNVVRL